MFTGLIETLGTIVSVEKTRGAALLGIRPDAAGFCPLPGASVAIDGVCLTLENSSGGVHFFTAVAETLERTTLGRKRTSSRVNLELAMKADGRFDGHFVLGHVDGVGTIVADNRDGAGVSRTLRVPGPCAPLMAEKGSVAIDGISLTIAKVNGCEITLALIPRTLEATTLSLKRVGDEVNIECDVLARYIHGMMKGEQSIGRKGRTHDSRESLGRVHSGGETLLAHMERAGF
jgi:riboflavin synthase